MVGFAKKASRDTRIVKMLTLLTLVYLPASLVSVGPCPSESKLSRILTVSSLKSVMGMGYVTVESLGSNLSFHVRGEFWIFMVLTVVLLLVTLGSYYWWLRRGRSVKARAKLVEYGNSMVTW